MVTKTNKLLQNYKTQKVTKLKNSICDKTQKLKLWQNSKTQIFTTKNLNYSICDKTQKPELWQNYKKESLTKLKKKWKTYKVKLWQNSKTSIVSNLKNFNQYKTQKLKTLTCNKSKNSSCDKTQILKLWKKEKINK